MVDRMLLMQRPLAMTKRLVATRPPAVLSTSMEDESDAIPPIHIDDLIAELTLSKQQVERGECFSADRKIRNIAR
jgi:hypothetical protein